MFDKGGAIHDGLSSAVTEEKVEYPRISVASAMTSLVVVTIFTLATGGALLWFIPPPDSFTYSLERVNASYARAPHPGCYAWDDHTNYGDDGLELPQFSDIAQFYVKSALLGDEMFKQVYELQCTAPDVPEAVKFQSTAALVENYNGGQYQVGTFQVPCVHPDKKGMRAVSLGANMATNCDAGKGRADALYSSAVLASGSKAPPATWGADCKVRNIKNDVTARYVMFRQWWHWPQAETWPGFYSSVYLFCDGLEGVQADFKGTFHRDLTADELQTLQTTNKLCAIKDGDTCLLSYQKQRWGRDPIDPSKTNSEWTKVMFDEVDCSNRFAQPEDFAPTSTKCADVKTKRPNTVTFFRNVNATYPEFAGDITPVVAMFSKLTGAPWASSPADISYMQLSCPGRGSMLESILHTGSNNGEANERTLNATIEMFQRTTPYTFQCTVKVPPTFSDRLSTVWPYIQMVQAVAFAYGLKYLYQFLAPAEKPVDVDVEAQRQPLVSPAAPEGPATELRAVDQGSA